MGYTTDFHGGRLPFRRPVPAVTRLGLRPRPPETQNGHLVRLDDDHTAIVLAGRRAGADEYALATELETWPSLIRTRLRRFGRPGDVTRTLDDYVGSGAIPVHLADLLRASPVHATPAVGGTTGGCTQVSGRINSALEEFTAGAQAHSLLTGVDALALPITGWLAATRARLGMPDEARATLTGFSTEREREGGAVAHELVALDAICNERAVICLMEGDPATALDVLRDLQDVTPPVDFPACAFVEAHLLAGIATWTWGIETRPLPQPSGVELSRDLGPRQICR